MTLALLAIGAGVGLGWWLLQPAERSYHTGQQQADFPPFLHGTCVMTEGSILNLQHEGSPHQLRFREVRLGGGRHGLRLEIPDTPAARECVGCLRERLTAAGFTSSHVKPLSPWWPAQGLILVAIDQLTAVEAFRAAEVARDAMGLSPDARFTIHYEGMPSLRAIREHAAAQ